MTHTYLYIQTTLIAIGFVLSLGIFGLFIHEQLTAQTPALPVNVNTSVPETYNPQTTVRGTQLQSGSTTSTMLEGEINPRD